MADRIAALTRQLAGAALGATPSAPPFNKVLIANRGEIAIRIAGAADHLGKILGRRIVASWFPPRHHPAPSTSTPSRWMGGEQGAMQVWNGRAGTANLLPRTVILTFGNDTPEISPPP